MAITTGLEHYWRFDEKSNDRFDSISDLHLQFASFGSVPADLGWTTGKIGNAVDIGRSPGHNALLYPDGDTATRERFQTNATAIWTFHCWFFMRDIVIGSQPLIHKISNNGSQWGIYYDTLTGGIVFRINGLGSAGSTKVQSSVVITQGDDETQLDEDWFCVTVWYDGPAATCGISVNNETPQTDPDVSTYQQTLNSDPATPWIPVGPWIGGRMVIDSFGSAKDFVGYLDNFAWWSRVLTSAERDLVWGDGRGLDFLGDDDAGVCDLLPSMKAHWRLEETAGDRIDDIGSNDLSVHADNPITVPGKVIDAARLEQGNGGVTDEKFEILAAGADADLRLANNESMTFTAWVRVGGDVVGEFKIPEHTTQLIAYKGDVSAVLLRDDFVNNAQSDEVEWILYYDGGLNRFALKTWARNTFSSPDSDGHYEIVKTNPIELEVDAITGLSPWFFLGASIEHSDDGNEVQVRLRVNGQGHGAFAWQGETDGQSSGFNIGTGQGGAFGTFPTPSGSLFLDIDEATFWKRSLSTLEHVHLYNSRNAIDATGVDCSPLFLKSKDTTAKIMPLIMFSDNIGFGAIPLWISAQAEREEMPLFMHADGIHVSSMPLFIEGFSANNEDFLLFINGVWPSHNIPLFLKGKEVQTDNNDNIPLFIHAAAAGVTGGLFDLTTLFIKGTALNNALPLFLKVNNTSDPLTKVIPLYMKVGGDLVDGVNSAGLISLFLQNDSENALMDLYVRGAGPLTGSDGYKPYSNQMPLFINRPNEPSAITMFLKAIDVTENGNIPLYMFGVLGIPNDNITLYMPTHGEIATAIDPPSTLYTHGWI